MSGAAPVPTSLIETYAKLGIEIHQVYGLTESCGPACLSDPDSALERRIVRARLPQVGAEIEQQLVAFVQALRELDLKKPPAVSETLDWARALVLLHVEQLSPEWVRDTLNVLLKEQEDVVAVSARLPELLAGG